jgi:hypothetical protein
MTAINKPERKKDRKLLDSFKDQRCLVCGRRGAVAHHVKSKGSGGSDEPWNLMSLDLIHHNEVHSAGLTAFAAKYRTVHLWLLANGWEFDDQKRKWTHYD